MTFSQFATALVLIAACALTWFGVEVTVVILLVGRQCYFLRRRVSARHATEKWPGADRSERCRFATLPERRQ